MRNIAKIGNRLSVVALAAAAVFVLSAGDAFAASGIFETMRSKVATTLKDLRMIIYVVGGIGLITFTFAAIFGKISFKHLANICFSLFLVAMISPFVRFFTGDESALAELTYNNYLSPVNGSADDQTVNGSCGSNCPSSANGGMGTGGTTSGTGRYTAPQFTGDGDVTYDGGTLGEVVVTAQAPKNNNPLGITPPTIEVPTTLPEINIPTTTTPPADTRTGWQKFKDTIKTVAKEGKKAVNTASSVYSAAKNVKAAIDNTTNALGNMHGIEGILNAGTVTATSVQNIAGNVQHAAAAVGENYTDKEGQPTANDKVGAALGQIVDGAKEGEDVFRTGTEIKETTDAGVRLGGDILSGKGLK